MYLNNQVNFKLSVIIFQRQFKIVLAFISGSDIMTGICSLGMLFTEEVDRYIKRFQEVLEGFISKILEKERGLRDISRASRKICECKEAGKKTSRTFSIPRWRRAIAISLRKTITTFFSLWPTANTPLRISRHFVNNSIATETSLLPLPTLSLPRPL